LAGTPEPTRTPADEQPDIPDTPVARESEDAEATRASKRLFALLRERAMENPDDVALLERLGRAFYPRTARTSSPDSEAPS
jgi:cytochrome c-type biogenesis protein CcmH/NrfG